MLNLLIIRVYILCAILELFGTIPEPLDKVGIPTLRRTIPELYRFLLCAKHIHLKCTNKYKHCDKTVKQSAERHKICFFLFE